MYKRTYLKLKRKQCGGEFSCFNPNASLLNNVCKKDVHGEYKSIEECITPCLNERHSATPILSHLDDMLRKTNMKTWQWEEKISGTIDLLLSAHKSRMLTTTAAAQKLTRLADQQSHRDAWSAHTVEIFRKALTQLPSAVYSAELQAMLLASQNVAWIFTKCRYAQGAFHTQNDLNLEEYTEVAPVVFSERPIDLSRQISYPAVLGACIIRAKDEVRTLKDKLSHVWGNRKDTQPIKAALLRANRILARLEKRDKQPNTKLTLFYLRPSQIHFSNFSITNRTGNTTVIEYADLIAKHRTYMSALIRLRCLIKPVSVFNWRVDGQDRWYTNNNRRVAACVLGGSDEPLLCFQDKHHRRHKKDLARRLYSRNDRSILLQLNARSFRIIGPPQDVRHIGKKEKNDLSAKTHD